MTRPARRTRQRDAIRAVIQEADRPLAPADVLAGARRRVARIGLATVYRALRTLVDAAEVAVVQVPGEANRYERAGKAHHHHFCCRLCGGVFEVEGCPGELAKMAPPGFEVEMHEIILYGRCAACQPRQSRGVERRRRRP